MTTRVGRLIIWTAKHSPSFALRTIARSHEGTSRIRAFARWLLRPVASTDVIIPFGECAGLPFNASGSAPRFALGISEPEVQSMLRCLLKPGAIFYDVGANVGFYTILGARCVGPAGHVYAFEPVPSNIAALEYNLKLSSLEQQTTLIQSAVAFNSGISDFFLSKESFWGRLGSLGSPPGACNKIKVNVTSIDEAIACGLTKVPDVVKIDTEGAEAEVIKGMLRTLHEERPVIVCEIHDNYDSVSNLLKTHGYRVYPLIDRRRSGLFRHIFAMYND